MKDKILLFLKNKFNIAMIIVQVLAIICYLCTALSMVFVAFVFALEGIFFALWGIKILLNIKNSRYSQEIYNQLPYSAVQKENIRKLNAKSNKNNKFMGISLIILGTVLFCYVFSIIFSM